jgi:DNA-binding MarR family transcriptional regulator
VDTAADTAGLTADTAGLAGDTADLAGRLRMVVARLSRRIRRTRAGAGLTNTETSLLSTTVRQGRLGMSALAREEAMNPTTLSRVVCRLEGAGLLTRNTDPRDRRAAFVEATPAGTELHRQIRAERTDALSQLIDRLSDAERAALGAALPVLEQLASGLRERRR